MTHDVTPPLPDDSGPDDDLPSAPGAPLRAPEDVLAVLLDLVGPERGGPPALWVLFLDPEHRMLPAVLPISELPTVPHPALVDAVVQVMVSVLHHEAPGGSVALGLVRAEGGEEGQHEASWSSALRTAAAEAGVPVRLVAALGRDRARVLGV